MLRRSWRGLPREARSRCFCGDHLGFDCGRAGKERAMAFVLDVLAVGQNGLLLVVTMHVYAHERAIT